MNAKVALRCALVALPLLLSVTASAGTEVPADRAAPGATLVNLNEAKALFDRGAKFIDVRIEGSAEQHGRIAGSRILGPKHLDDGTLRKLASREDEVVFYCTNTGCANPYYAALAARESGYKKVYQLREGFDGWKAAGLPVDR